MTVGSAVTSAGVRTSSQTMDMMSTSGASEFGSMFSSSPMRDHSFTPTDVNFSDMNWTHAVPSPTGNSLYMYEQDRRNSNPNAGMEGWEESDVKPNLRSGLGDEFHDLSWERADFASLSQWSQTIDMENLKMADILVDKADAGPTLAELNFREDTNSMKTFSHIASKDTFTISEGYSKADVSNPARVSNLENVTSRLQGGTNFDGKSFMNVDVGAMPYIKPEPPDPEYTGECRYYSQDLDMECGLGGQCTDQTGGLGGQSTERGLGRQCPEQTIDGVTLYRLLVDKHRARAPQAKKSQPSPVATVTSGEMEQKWEEIREFIHEDEQTPDVRRNLAREARAKRGRWDSECSVATSNDDPDSSDMSDSDVDMDNQDSDDSNLSVDDDADDAALTPIKHGKQYFWQYNVQSKGPKGKRLSITLDASNPHVLPMFEDPVFDRDSLVPALTHGGRARKGDGNDIIPSPRRLTQLGKELTRINKQITDFLPLSELPEVHRSKSRREKNKLASRACRLKKKAQHEANKIQLCGLEKEHGELIEILTEVRHELITSIQGTRSDTTESLPELLHRLETQRHKHVVAGKSVEYVNQVLQSQ